MVLFLLILLFVFKSSYSDNVTSWGPGLSPDKIVLPARYFFIKVENIDEYNYHFDLKSKLQISISGDSLAPGTCRVWYNILDRKDGSFIIRYRLYHTCYKFEISIKYNDKHIEKSPYRFKGPIYAEDCDCPIPYSEWITNMGCKDTYNQIASDLNAFSEIDVDDTLSEVERRFNHPSSVSLCHYTVKSNRLFRKCYGKHVGFNMFTDAILLSLARKYIVADMSFFVNLGDWPLSKQNLKPLPIFSWCGSDDTYDIVLPTYDITQATLENMKGVTLDMLSIQGNMEHMWDSKIPKAFWRGRDSREERLKLIEIGKNYPNLYNASITNYFFFRDKENVYGKAPTISFFKFFDYKYQINIDGTVAAYRMPYLLAGNTLVLKQESPYYEHFYGDLKPNIHFVPFKRDLSDLTSKIKWAIKNEAEARKISLNGQTFTRENLMPTDIFCYHAKAFQDYSTRVTTPIKIYSGMEEVTQNEEAKNCQCDLLFKDEL